MRNLIQKRKSEGFTIIEVMIVLAIAGLILLIVFLAVPALQRNARNTTLKNDASALAAGFSEYSSNNNGAAPASIDISGLATNGTVLIGASGTAQAKAKVNASTTVVAAKTTPSTNTFGTLWWNSGKACDGTVNSRAVAIYYYAEGNASTTPQCVDGN
jgi:prepilin-type N-terminal cleavage/methylation domain-containing protein